MTIELRVPISATPSFCNQVLLQAASLRRFHPDAIVRVYIGHPLPMSRDHELIDDAFQGKRIGYEWVVGKEFLRWDGTRAPYLGQINRRWSYPIHGDTVIIADADVIFTGTLDDVLCRDAVQGVQAHVPPLSGTDFRHLFRICEAPEPQFNIYYTGSGIMVPPGKGPFYPNSGMVVLPRQHFEAVIPHYHYAISRMRGALRDVYWLDQLGLSIGAAKAAIPTLSLTPKFNFPNQVAFDQRYADDLRDVRALHYLRTDTINRVTDFENPQAIRRLIARSDLSGSNEVLRQTVAREIRALEPTPLDRAEDAPWA